MTASHITTLDLTVIGISAAWLAIIWLVYSKPRHHLPPGPKPLPIIGNVLQVSKDRDYVQYAEWAKVYGPIFTLKFLRQRLVILNSREVVAELLEKNINATSGRPVNMVMASELIGWGRAVALNAGGPQHLTYRRLLSTSLNSTAVRRYRSVQEQSAHSLLQLLAQDPADFLKHIRLVVGRSIVEITYGHDLKVRNEDYIDYAEAVHEVFSITAKPYTYLVDLIPSLRHIPCWVPGASFRKQADEWRKDLDDLAKTPFDTVKNEVETGEAPDSYVANLLRGEKSLKADEQDVMWTAASLYTGGSDTSICSLTVFVLLMCLNPEKQRKAQKELDDVLGGERLPTFEDQANLPYVTAVVKEVLRYWTIAPLGLPHRVMEDKMYGDYHIPAGSTMVGNIWAIMHDEKVYNDPFAFKPERFLAREHGGLDEPDPVPTVFGWGRRICPGMHLAEASLWIYAANVLAAMDVLPAKNERGEDVLPRELGTPGIICFPKPFDCRIVARSPAAALASQ